jgi:hypothetical protein
MTALERDPDGRPTLVETENDTKVRRVESRVRIRYEGPTRLSWRQEKGDMKSTPIPAGCRDWSSEGPVEATTRAILVNGRPDELRQRVEGG